MNEPYSYTGFIDQVKNLDYPEMIETCQRRCADLERGSYGVKGAVKRRKEGSTELAEKIKGILFWLYNGQKPNGLNEWDFAALKPICENLIEKGQFKSSAIDAFVSVQK
jgi:hypothetical protein